MVFGEAYDPRLGFAYAYVFEQLCNHHGQFLDNSAWFPIRFEFFEQIGRALDRAGVSTEAFTVECLISRKTPIPLPPIDEFPSVGGLAEDEVGPAVTAPARTRPTRSRSSRGDTARTRDRQSSPGSRCGRRTGRSGSTCRPRRP